MARGSAPASRSSRPTAASRASASASSSASSSRSRSERDLQRKARARERRLPRRARRLHERGQVHAPQRAHGRRRPRRRTCCSRRSTPPRAGSSLPEGREVTLTDTVGFIHKLPHGLVEAFKSTLDEVSEADLLLHVADAGAFQRDAQMQAVREVLEEIGASHTPSVVVYNKIDTLPDDRTRRAQAKAARSRLRLRADGRRSRVAACSNRRRGVARRGDADGADPVHAWRPHRAGARARADRDGTAPRGGHQTDHQGPDGPSGDVRPVRQRRVSNATRPSRG